MTDPAVSDELSFEDAITTLHEIVETLEAGDLSLDETIARFEHGTRLVAHCQRVIAEAELRVTELSRAADDADDASAQ